MAVAATAKHLIDRDPYFASLKYIGKSGFCKRDQEITSANTTSVGVVKKRVLLILLKDYDAPQQSMAYLNGVVKALEILSAEQPKRKHQTS